MEHILTYLNNFNLLTAALIFFSYMFVDALYAYYTLSVVALKPFRSATIGALMYFLLAIGIINYINNPLYLAPLFLGSWLGTFAIVYIKKRNKQQSH